MMFASYVVLFSFFFFNDTATTEIYTLSLHDALPIWNDVWFPLILTRSQDQQTLMLGVSRLFGRSEEHTSELQSHLNLVCRLLLEKKKKMRIQQSSNQLLKCKNIRTA